MLDFSFKNGIKEVREVFYRYCCGEDPCLGIAVGAGSRIKGCEQSTADAELPARTLFLECCVVVSSSELTLLIMP